MKAFFLVLTILILQSRPSQAVIQFVPVSEFSPSLFSQIYLTHSPEETLHLGLHHGQAFFNLETNYHQDPLVGLLRAKANETKLFAFRASYNVPLSPDSLSKDFFTNFTEIKRLLGPNYRVQLLSQQPFVFRGKRTFTYFFVTKTIESTAHVQVYNWNDFPRRDVTASITQLAGSVGTPLRVVVETVNNFNQYVLRSFLITVIYRDPRSKGSHLEVFSASLLDPIGLASLPESLVQSAISTVENEDLVGYATRLSER